MQTNSVTQLSLQQLKQAVTIREKIDSLEKELDQLFGGQAVSPNATAPGMKRRRRKMSAAARAKISAAAKARWKAFRAKKGNK